MGEIVFEGDPPYRRLDVRSAEARPTRDGVELVVNVFLVGPPNETAPVRILLQPEAAAALAAQLEPVVGAPRSLMDSQR
jgi:hypothetical protein